MNFLLQSLEIIAQPRVKRSNLTKTTEYNVLAFLIYPKIILIQWQIVWLCIFSETCLIKFRECYAIC